MPRSFSVPKFIKPLDSGKPGEVGGLVAAVSGLVLGRVEASSSSAHSLLADKFQEVHNILLVRLHRVVHLLALAHLIIGPGRLEGWRVPLALFDKHGKTFRCAACTFCDSWSWRQVCILSRLILVDEVLDKLRVVFTWIPLTITELITILYPTSLPDRIFALNLFYLGHVLTIVHGRPRSG